MAAGSAKRSRHDQTKTPCRHTFVCARRHAFAAPAATHENFTPTTRRNKTNAPTGRLAERESVGANKKETGRQRHVEFRKTMDATQPSRVCDGSGLPFRTVGTTILARISFAS